MSNIEKLLKSAMELKINLIGKENTITFGQIMLLGQKTGISGFDIMRMIGELNDIN